MYVVRRRSCVLFVAGLCLAAAGCSPGASALTKFQSGQIGDLDAAEWQALAGLGSSVGLTVPQLNDQQAQALVDVLDQNGIQTTEELQTALNAGTVVVPQELLDLFGA